MFEGSSPSLQGGRREESFDGERVAEGDERLQERKWNGNPASFERRRETRSKDSLFEGSSSSPGSRTSNWELGDSTARPIGGSGTGRYSGSSAGF